MKSCLPSGPWRGGTRPTVRMFLEVFASIPKTTAFNFAVLPFREAVRLPVMIHRRTRVVACRRGAVRFGGSIATGQVRIGFPHLDYPGRDSSLKLTGVITFSGQCSLLTGIDLNVTGDLALGDGVRCGESVKIDCKDRSSIGQGVVIGPECYFSDDDGHQVIDSNGDVLNPARGFRIGDHVWYGRGCATLKGVEVASGVVVGAGSVVTRSVLEGNVVVAGNPAVVVKSGVRWRA